MKLIVNWAASCGGCDVSILDCGKELLNLIEKVEVLYWPVALDFKRKDLEKIEDKSVDFGIVNGAIRTSEQEEELKIVREKCKFLIAYGSCACFGGIPGLANLFERNSILKRAYIEAQSNLNEEGIIPEPEVEMDGYKLNLPEFYNFVRPLDNVVKVDCYVPGCPPSTSTIQELLNSLPKPDKRFFASDKSLCHECPLNRTKEAKRVEKFYRPHEVNSDEKCLLEKGIMCLGFATRGGCGARCISVNMPCRGCYGKLPAMVDSGDAMSSIASIAGDWEDYIPTAKIFEVLSSLKDPAGLFYMFSLPSGVIGRCRGEE
ncbi:MAG TPA: oxidoreductase [Archaeoglobaceae archaeon]|nr:oxidoreductase [Archaeoglobaceae archaeon]